MGKHSPVVVTPRYLSRFSCIGPTCEDNCCHDWKVGIDKRTYKKYQTISVQSLAVKLKSALKKVEADSTDANYAYIELGQDGNCPMLSTAGLCDIHSQLGEGYLSHTCTQYPRTYYKENGQLRMFATLSCPEAARLALLKADSMDAVELSLPIPNEGALPPHPQFHAEHHDGQVLQAFAQPIREIACHLIRTPMLSAAEGMILLGLMTRKLDRVAKENAFGEASQKVAQTLMEFCNPGFIKQAQLEIQTIPPSREFQIKLIGEISKLIHSAIVLTPAFRSVVSDALQGLQFDPAAPEGLETRFLAAENGPFRAFDEHHPHILKNYLLNDLGRHAFPNPSGLGMVAEFLDLAVRFSLIKMYLVGVAAHRGSAFDGNDYVRVIYSFARNVEHRSKFLALVYERLKESGLDNIATATILLR